MWRGGGTGQAMRSRGHVRSSLCRLLHLYLAAPSARNIFFSSSTSTSSETAHAAQPACCPLLQPRPRHVSVRC